MLIVFGMRNINLTAKSFFLESFMYAYGRLLKKRLFFRIFI
jgi:hypothetical protein